LAKYVTVAEGSNFGANPIIMGSKFVFKGGEGFISVFVSVEICQTRTNGL